MKAAIRDEDPVLYFEHKKCYLAFISEVPEEDYIVPIGKADVKRQGTDITVIAYGMVVNYALQAAEELAKEGISAHVLDLRTLQPLDREAILEAARKTGKVLITHEDNKTGGVGAEVLRLSPKKCYSNWMRQSQDYAVLMFRQWAAILRWRSFSC